MMLRRRRATLVFGFCALACSAVYFLIAGVVLRETVLPAPLSRYSASNTGSFNIRSSFKLFHKSPEYTPSSSQRLKLRSLSNNLNLTSEEMKSWLPITIQPKYIFNNATLCSGVVDILFMVHTATANFENRDRLRRVSTNSTFYKPLKVRTLFLLGQSTSTWMKNNVTRVQENLELEHSHFKDTVQGDFLDTYHNLSLKGVMGFHWVTHFCPHARLVFKLDDDVFVDAFKLTERFFSIFVSKKKAIFCNVLFNKTSRVMRSGKWKVENSRFWGQDFYPYPYCSGIGVFMSGDVIPLLFQTAHFTPTFWVDDLYLFGILPTMVGENITLYDIGRGFSSYFRLNANKMLECREQLGRECPILLSMSNPTQFAALWNNTYNFFKDATKAYHTLRLN